MNFKILALVIIGITFLFDTYMKYLETKSAEREIPDNVKDVYDSESYKKWLSYDREKNKLSFYRHLVSYLIAFSVIGFDLYAKILSWFGFVGFYQTALAVLVADTVIAVVYAIPFAYINTMKIEQKYGFNRMTMKTFVADQIKDMIVNLVIMGGILCLFIALHLRFGKWILLIFSVVMMVILLAFVFLTPFTVKLYNKLEDLPEGELRERLKKLLLDNGCSVRAIKVSDGSKRSTKANAYFAGFGKMKTIVLFDTLLEQMTDDEIVAVFAHEMGHNKHKDTLKMYGMSMLNIVLCVVLIFGLVSMPEIYGAFGFTGLNYGFALVLLSNVCLSFLSPFIGLFTGALSRRFEYAADAFAAKNGYGSALVSGLKKLSRNSFSCLNPHPLVVKLTYSHPTVSQRIAALDRKEKTCQR